jgi:TRAP-type C4-dicarboxylate transport system substrate-binding protein
MNVTLKPAPESYELLSTGVMDGTLFPAESTRFVQDRQDHQYATSFPGGLYNTSFVFMMNQAKYDKLSADEKKVVDAISGEAVARMFGKGWDRVDADGVALQKQLGVQHINASPAFVAEVQAKASVLEDKWAADAEAKGLKNAKGVLAEFRAEIVAWRACGV